MTRVSVNSSTITKQQVQGREANRRRHRLTEPTTKALCQPPTPLAVWWLWRMVAMTICL